MLCEMQTKGYRLERERERERERSSQKHGRRRGFPYHKISREGQNI